MINRTYYIANHTIWNDEPCTSEVLPHFGSILRVDTITVNGKEYEASYFGEADMSDWSDRWDKREFWRLENAFEDFADKQGTFEMLPYDNYPIYLEEGQVFVIDYHTKKYGTLDRKYYIADGSTFEGLPSTREVCLEPAPVLRTEKITVNGKEYTASYFGEEDMTDWHETWVKRDFWRLEDAYNDFAGNRRTGNHLPFNNYPMDMEEGQMFAIDLHTKENGKIERQFFVADGATFEGQPATREVLLAPYATVLRVEKMMVNGKEYTASYFGEEDMSSWNEKNRKREFWRLEDVCVDFAQSQGCGNVLPYANYIMHVESGQVFVIDYHSYNGDVNRQYYVADDFMWQGLLATRQVLPWPTPGLRTDKLTVNGKEYAAAYYGQQDLTNWSEPQVYAKRDIWRLDNVGGDFANAQKDDTDTITSYYYPMYVQPGEVFVLDCYKANGTVERKIYLAEGEKNGELLTVRLALCLDV